MSWYSFTEGCSHSLCLHTEVQTSYGDDAKESVIVLNLGVDGGREGGRGKGGEEGERGVEEEGGARRRNTLSYLFL